MKELIVSSSPHIHDKRTTRSIMLDVIIAMVPAAVASVVFFGFRALVVILFCAAVCMGMEALWNILAGKEQSVGDLSAAVTGVMLAFNLPAGIPLWQAVVGCAVAIIVVKMLFGGIGCNFVNPALAGRVVMAVSFTTTMTNYSYPKGAVDVLASATPLRIIEQGGSVDLWTAFIGNHGGVLGETSCLALLIGALYLLARTVIKISAPITFIASTTLFSWLFGCAHPIGGMLSGGLFLGAFFMATDYTTTPYSTKGRIVFGLGCGFITALIRMYANSNEGVSYAILIMNLLVPYINDLCRKRPFGAEKGGAK